MFDNIISTVKNGVARDNVNVGIFKNDEEKNKVRSGEIRDISAPDSKVRVLVVPTNEEYMIALDVQELLGK